MNESGFRDWLTKNYKPNSVSTKLSECRNLALAYGDLDQLYDTDRLDGVMQDLAYSAEDRAALHIRWDAEILADDGAGKLPNMRVDVFLRSPES